VPIVLGASDPDANGCGLPLTGYALVTPPAHGTLSGVPPNLVYTPDPNFPSGCGHNNGADSFTFVAMDGQCTSDPATVNIRVI